MKIVKLEDFHADGGWDTYSFLKFTTDEGITGWSEFNESRRKGMTSLIHGLGATLIGEDPCAIARIDALIGGDLQERIGVPAAVGVEILELDDLHPVARIWCFVARLPR